VQYNSVCHQQHAHQLRKTVGCCSCAEQPQFLQAVLCLCVCVCCCCPAPCCVATCLSVQLNLSLWLFLESHYRCHRLATPTASAAPARRGTCFTDSCKLAAQAPANPFSAATMPAFKPTAGRKAGGMRPGTLQKQQQGAGASSAAPAATALFDPAAPGAIVVNAGQWQEGRGKLSGGRPVVPVVSKRWVPHAYISSHYLVVGWHPADQQYLWCAAVNSQHIC
jgi:hypothetical protein